MEYLLAFLLFAATWHFVYEAILMPSFRHQIRYKLFVLRDRIRKLKIEKEEQVSDKVFDYIDKSINGSIRRLSKLSLTMMIFGVYEIRKNRKIKDNIDNRIKLIEDSSNEEIKKISEENTNLALYVLFVNSGGWIPYILTVLFPFVVLFIAYVLIRYLNLRARVITNNIKRFIYTPDHLVEPFGGYSAA